MTQQPSDPHETNVRRGRHDWNYAASSARQAGEDQDQWAVALAICGMCGVVRSTSVAAGGEARLDLAGGCEGRPERAEVTRERPRLGSTFGG